MMVDIGTLIYWFDHVFAIEENLIIRYHDFVFPNKTLITYGLMKT